MRSLASLALFAVAALALASYGDSRGFASLAPAPGAEPTFSLILPAPTPQEPDRLDVADWGLTALDCMTAASELEGARCVPEPARKAG